jgi:hypothetical protein
MSVDAGLTVSEELTSEYRFYTVVSTYMRGVTR